MILYIENLKNPPENYYSKSINIVMSHDIKLIQKNYLHSYTLTMKIENEKETIPFCTATKGI